MLGTLEELFSLPSIDYDDQLRGLMENGITGAGQLFDVVSNRAEDRGNRDNFWH